MNDYIITIFEVLEKDGKRYDDYIEKNELYELSACDHCDFCDHFCDCDSAGSW